MNVFEDLVSELLEDNLLEASVMDLPQRGDQGEELALPPMDIGDAEPEVELVDIDKVETDSYHTEIPLDDYSFESSGDIDIETNETLAATPDARASIPKKPTNGREFYKKRAINEISNLQMVEHVLTGVEREYMRMAPKVFDDFNAKKTLNAFLQVAGNENTVEHAEAEFAMIEETESWCSALAERDHKITVSNLRHYCENSKPALSSQALLALARFYRNLPYCEAVRSKFDFVITRLFSKGTATDVRICLFTKVEMREHINTLYRDWTSIPLYSLEHDETGIRMTAQSFEDLAVEAENASSFDDLLASDFFGRLRAFKESISEVYYAPEVLVAAIDANVRIGNTYFELISLERQKLDANSIQHKYADLIGNEVSDAAGRTLNLVDLRKSATLSDRESDNKINSEYTPVNVDRAEAPTTPTARLFGNLVRTLFRGSLTEMFLSMNRALLGISLALILGSLGIYVWANYFVRTPAPSASSKSIDLDDPILREHISRANTSGDVFFGRLQPSWDGLTKDQRQQYLEKVFSVVKAKGSLKVTLIGKNGKVAGYASSSRIEVYMP